jgi:hypothetical protein
LNTSLRNANFQEDAYTQCVNCLSDIRWYLYLLADKLKEISCVKFEYVHHNPAVFYKVTQANCVQSQPPSYPTHHLLYSTARSFLSFLVFVYLAPDSHIF